MYKVSLRKERSIWHWFTTNPQGGGFGSSYRGPKHIALKAATRHLRSGQQYELTTNGRVEGVLTVA